MGRNSIVHDEAAWWYLEKLEQISNTRVWETQVCIEIVQYGDSSEEGWTWLSQIEYIGKKKYRAEFENEEFWIKKWKFWNKRRGQESVVKTAWTQNSRRLLAMGNQRAVFKKETIAVSDTISISVQNRHSRILLQELLRSRVWKMHGEPEVLEAEAQVWNWLECRARITSKELAPLHSVKNGILRSARSTRQKKDANWVISALTHTARLTNSLAKSLKRMVTKVQWPYWRIHDNWVAYFRIWSRRSLHRFCGRAQTYWSQSNVWNSQKPLYVTPTFETKNHRLE